MLTTNEKFIIGLGNPGKKYTNNRHNVGFLFVKELATKYQSKIILKSKLKCFYSEFSHNGIFYRLFMPNTYMNSSGDSVRAVIDWFKIDLEKIYIIVDDIDIPLGKIRFRKKGSSGGHNGLKSIIANLNTTEFNRIRVGISSPQLKSEKNFNTISHVLGDFSKKEREILDKVNLKIIESIEKISKENENNIMCELNSFYAS